MHWAFLLVFLLAVEVQQNDAVFSIPARMRIKNLLDTLLGAEEWSVRMAGGDTVEETANIAERMQKIIIQSNNVPGNSGLDNATIVMDFKKGMFAALFLDTDMGHMCFFAKENSSFGESVAEIKRRSKSQISIQQGDPITFYALNNKKITNKPSLLRNGGPAVFRICQRFIENGNVFQVVREMSENMTPNTLTASGFISASQPGKSVPIVFKMEKDSTANNI